MNGNENHGKVPVSSRFLNLVACELQKVDENTRINDASNPNPSGIKEGIDCLGGDGIHGFFLMDKPSHDEEPSIDLYT